MQIPAATEYCCWLFVCCVQHALASRAEPVVERDHDPSFGCYECLVGAIEHSLRSRPIVRLVLRLTTNRCGLSNSLRPSDSPLRLDDSPGSGVMRTSHGGCGPGATACSHLTIEGRKRPQPRGARPAEYRRPAARLDSSRCFSGSDNEHPRAGYRTAEPSDSPPRASRYASGRDSGASAPTRSPSAVQTTTHAGQIPGIPSAHTLQRGGRAPAVKPQGR